MFGLAIGSCVTAGGATWATGKLSGASSLIYILHQELQSVLLNRQPIHAHFLRLQLLVHELDHEHHHPIRSTSGFEHWMRYKQMLTETPLC